MLLNFTVIGDPQALKRHRSFKKGRFIGHYDPSSSDKADFLSMAYQHKPDAPLTGPLVVGLIFRFTRPKSHFGTGKNKCKVKYSAPFLHFGKPDLDNLEKFVFDALNGVFWKDDSCISIGFKKKFYTSSTPSVTVMIDTATNDVRDFFSQWYYE